LALGGQLQFALGNSGQAIDWWEHSLRLNPQLAEAWCGLAVARWEHGDFEAAVTAMHQVQQTNARLADERIYVWVDALLNLGREREAITLLESRAQGTGLSPSGLLMLGQAYLQAEDYAQAQRAFAAALAAEPRLANAHYGLAKALTAVGQTEQAQKHHEEYARWKQQDLAVWDRLRGAGRGLEKANPAEVRGVLGGFSLRAGKIYAARGRFPEAEACWRRAVELEPQNPEPRQLLESLPADRDRR
jgi:tetratricopeptide (TPR) repeat protein